MKGESTGKLLNQLKGIKSKKDLTRHINNRNLKEEQDRYWEYILRVCDKKGYSKNDIIRNADIYRTYGYQILNGSRWPGRDKLLMIAIGNNFTLDETNRLLTMANIGILYAKDLRDSIIIFALNNKTNLINTNILLEEYNLDILE